MTSENRKLFVNTFSLATRLLLTVVVAFFSTRIVLSALGVVDYGIYNVVGSVIAMVAFLSSAMNSGVQRHLSFALGRGEVAEVNAIYNASLRIHFIIALVVFLLVETVGRFFFESGLNIPVERKGAAHFVYQCVAVVVLSAILSNPSQALITAKQDMHVLAVRGIVESLLRLGAAVLIKHVSHNRLEVYASAMAAISVFLAGSYFWYCHKRYKEAELIRAGISPRMYAELTGFAGWTLFGVLGAVCRGQGLAVVLNVFFGPAMNAAYGIGNQIQSQILVLASTVLRPFAPQVVGAYQRDNDRMRWLTLVSSRFSVLLTLLIGIPLMLKTELILGIWLKHYPSEAVSIVRLLLVNLTLTVVTNPLITVMQATGRIALYQAIIGTLFILNVPVAYFLLKVGFSYWAPFMSLIAITITTNAIKLAFAKKPLGLSAGEWMQQTLLRPVIVVAAVGCFDWLLGSAMHAGSSLLANMLELALVMLATVIAIYFLGLAGVERERLWSMAFRRFGAQASAKSP